MKAKVDFKEYALKYGEKAGLGAAVVIMLLLALFGFMASSGTTNQEEIKKKADLGTTRLNTLAPPQPSDLVPADAPSAKVLHVRSQRFHEGFPFEWFRFPFSPLRKLSTDDYLKEMPAVFAPTELAATPIWAAYRVRDIRGDDVIIALGERNMLVKVKSPTKGMTKRERKAIQDLQRGQGSGAGTDSMGPPGYPGIPGGGAMSGRSGVPGVGIGTPDKPGAEPPPMADPGTKDVAPVTFHGERKKIDDYKPEKDVIAVTIVPARGVLVAGSYPHLQQMVEIANALRLSGPQDIRVSYYKTLDIERRLIVPKGKKLVDGKIATEDLVYIPAERTFKPVDPSDLDAPAGGWVPVDLKYVTLLMRLSEGDVEQDTKLLDAVRLDGLAMTLPKPYIRPVGDRPKDASGYPNVYANLKQLQATLDKIKDETKVAKPKPRLTQDDLDPFNYRPSQGATEGTAPGTAAPGTAAPGAASTIGPRGTPMRDIPMGEDTTPAEGTAAGATIPDTTMVRFLDLDQTMRPGQTYEYRVRVVLHNPNYKQQDVADPSFAASPELRGNWSAPTPRVTLPEEIHLYVDERPRLPKLEEKERVPIFIHKWVDWVRKDGADEPSPLGEWWVERLWVARGEYVGRVNETQKIIWVSTSPDPTTNTMGRDAVQKSPYRTDALLTGTLLVDFDGGNVFRQRLGKGTVEATTPVEALMIEPDGKMVARSYAEDKDDTQRKERQSKFDTWLKEVAGKQKQVKEKGDFNK